MKEEEQRSQIASDPVCVQRFIEQFRAAYINKTKFIYKADIYPWFGHYAKSIMLDGVEYNDISIKVFKNIDMHVLKKKYTINNGIASFNYNKHFFINSYNKFTAIDKYLYPKSKNEWSKQLKDVFASITEDKTLNEILEKLAIIPKSEFKELNSNQIKFCVKKLTNKRFITKDIVSCINDEEILISLLRACEGNIEKQKSFIDGLMESGSINRLFSHIDGSILKEFVFKVSKYYSNTVTPDLTEIQRKHYNSNGLIYTKIFNWDETKASNKMFVSDNIIGLKEFRVSTKYDLFSILQDKKYLMNLKPFEYVGLSVTNVYSYLPTGFSNGESILIVPAFLFHYIVCDKEFEQKLNDISNLIDIGLTVATLGKYAVGKTAYMIGRKSLQGAIIDFGIQTFFNTLDGTTWENAIKEVDFSNVAWAGASIHISQTKATNVLNCIRQGLKAGLNTENLTLSDVLLKAGEACVVDVAIALLASKTVAKLDNYSKIIIKKLESSPVFVTKRLLKYGVSIEIIQSFKNSITKDSIKRLIETTINNYENDKKK